MLSEFAGGTREIVQPHRQRGGAAHQRGIDVDHEARVQVAREFLETE
jgi:hypothetical protein